MLNPRDIDREDAGGFAWAAAMDAQRRDTNAKTLFTDAQKAQAVRMMDALSDCYHYERIYITHRPGRAPAHRSKCIAITIRDYIVSDRKKLKFLTDGWQQDPSIVVDPVRTNQGIIYRVYFT